VQDSKLRARFVMIHTLLTPEFWRHPEAEEILRAATGTALEASTSPAEAAATVAATEAPSAEAAAPAPETAAPAAKPAAEAAAPTSVESAAPAAPAEAAACRGIADTEQHAHHCGHDRTHRSRRASLHRVPSVASRKSTATTCSGSAARKRSSGSFASSSQSMRTATY